MSVVSGPSNAGLVARVQNMITKPAAEWDVIAGEPASVGGLFTGYACILAAIGPIASIIGEVLFLHWSPIVAVLLAVLSYVLSLAGAYLVAFIVDTLAPNFGAEKNQIQALKLVIYANTAAWLAGIGGLIPPLAGLLGLAGSVYTLYVMYLGLPKLMKSPEDKTTGYFIITLVVAAVVYAVIAFIVYLVIVATAVTAVVAGGAALSTVH
jgi:hypothetical protein